ncbi:hypothetical protein FRACYDRAFT_238477 [Fragilariopsis cylindrus CCMP1102]|uniref:Uncharacterized protein n=1 Tax=Fragilariopsis cylindrus CCMP1102 TaxID=635003 RepID=A0A1E7FIU5_9STRA|nr:hypothetical protein FRACYDRAFT_238477 [Fragilariopsis cylindrus CCMP1102]|eukprot:OEU18044.1 hypothetical protein FRACYDRAFT_238477 [Fragilariopsis cylindrus CCMP1102]
MKKKKKKKQRGVLTNRNNPASAMVMLIMALLLTTIAIIYSLFFLTPTDNRSPPSLYFEYPMLLSSSSFITANKTKTTTANTNTANTKKSAAAADEKPTTTTKSTTTPLIIRRYDEAGPKPIPGTERSHTLPNAIPITRIIPRNQVENKTYHLQQRTNTSDHNLSIIYPLPRQGKFRDDNATKGRYDSNHNYTTDYRTLYLYNPSILPLHNTIPKEDDNDPNVNDSSMLLSKDDLFKLTGGDSNVQYVVIYRAYLSNNCFGNTNQQRKMMKAGEQISYLAIALLDSKLNLIENSDILIDLNVDPQTRGLYYRQFMEDCRLFIIQKSIYLICNEECRRIQIKRNTNSMNMNMANSTTNSTTSSSSSDNTGSDTGYIYPNIYGNGLQITSIGSNTKIGGGKNFNIFQTTTKRSNTDTNDSTSTTDYYIQYRPLPHQYRKLINIPTNDDDDKNKNVHQRLDLFKTTISNNEKSIEQEAPRLILGDNDNGHNNIDYRGYPKPTFHTPDIYHNITVCEDNIDGTASWNKNCTNPIERSFFDINKDHGSACCVRVLLPRMPENEKQSEQEVMVGISHQKLSIKNKFWLKDSQNRYESLISNDQFVSRFIAYDIHYPFRIVAISGWFCLGFGTTGSSSNTHTDTDSQHQEQQQSTLAGHNMDIRLNLFNETYNCPIIHFISGFSEVVGNTSRAIIGYGINDCHPRMFILEKTEIIKLLVPTTN